MRMLHRFLFLPLLALLFVSCGKQVPEICIKLDATQSHSNRMWFAVEQLQQACQQQGCRVTIDSLGLAIEPHRTDIRYIYLSQQPADSVLHKEGFHIAQDNSLSTFYSIHGDGSGLIYGARELIDNYISKGNFDFPADFADAPEMVLRGPCIGVQKTQFLPGRGVYEYPYTPENFPWFYDKQMWLRYLDMMVENRMNSLYLWNGHPFASLVKLDDYPFAVEVDEDTFQKNRDLFSFLTREADRRGIFVIQMFYNIIVSKPFAEHYGIKTQDRNRPIDPLLSDYTRKSIAAFVHDYPNVGLLITLGEALSGNDRKLDWMINTIIPGVKDGLAQSGRIDEPPILLRAHDVDCRAVMDQALPVYKNIYTMHKYNGESLTTYQPRGPWAEIHKSLSELGSIHVSNVHILANLEPWRWASPDFVQKTVGAMHSVHGANALHLFPQSAYWDHPYTADDLGDGKRELQIDRDWMWFATWGRYAWHQGRDRQEEIDYWNQRLADFYGTSIATADQIRQAYEASGEIAPKLLRRFGITEGNRETLLLGLFESQLVNPHKYTVYYGFYESCGPEGEKLIEWSEKEWKGEDHIPGGEFPLDIVEQCIDHGDAALHAILEADKGKITRNHDEFLRLRNDMACYQQFAHFMYNKVQAAKLVLDYQWSHKLQAAPEAECIQYLDQAVPYLEKSLEHWRQLVQLTEGHYLYANSMQTAQRRIPIGGDDGKNKTWAEMLPHYERELAAFCANIEVLKAKAAGQLSAADAQITPLQDAQYKLFSPQRPVRLTEGAQLFTNLPEARVEAVADELKGLTALAFEARKPSQTVQKVLEGSTASAEHDGVVLDFDAQEPLQILVAYFRDDQSKYAKAPKLETDATANEYGQAEPQLQNAIHLTGLPLANVHTYQFQPGHHTLNLPAGYLLVLGFTNSEVKPRNVGLGGNEDAVDWLFY